MRPADRPLHIGFHLVAAWSTSDIRPRYGSVRSFDPTVRVRSDSAGM